MNKLNLGIGLLLIPLLMSACSAPQEETDLVSTRADDVPMIEEAEVATPVPSREALYVYNAKQSPQKMTELTLEINGEPLLLGSSYVRLVGVVSGRQKVALVEIGGRGRVICAGSGFNGYEVASIYKDSVELVKKGVMTK